MSRIGIIGGSGLYQIDGIKNIKKVHVETPFGDPSDAFILGEFAGREVVFLPRHAGGHRLLPTEVPYRANIFAMKKLGVTHILSVSAVGSLRKDYVPTDVVIIDTPIDLRRLIDIKQPSVRVTYDLEETGSPTMADVLQPFIK